MQDIFTSLMTQEVSQAMKAKAFVGMQAALIVASSTIGAVSFYGEYVGAVLVLFFPAHYPDLAQSNGCAYPCDPTDGAAVPAHKGRGVKPLAPQQGGGATRHSQLHQGVLAPFLLGHDQTRFRVRSTASDRSTIPSGHYPLLIKIMSGKEWGRCLMKQNPSSGHKKHLQMARTFRADMEQALIVAKLKALRVERERLELDGQFQMNVLRDELDWG